MVCKQEAFEGLGPAVLQKADAACVAVEPVEALLVSFLGGVAEEESAGMGGRHARCCCVRLLALSKQKKQGGP